MLPETPTEDGLVSPERRHLGADEGQDGQVDEPHEEEGAEVLDEVHLVLVAVVVGAAQLHQEPDHDDQAEGQRGVARPRLPLVRVGDDVVDLHLRQCKR